MQHREGIVGSWQSIAAAPANPPQETDANLARWEPWVRAQVLDFDLFSRLHFAAEAGAWTLWDADILTPGNAPTVSTHRIVRMSRPPDDQSGNAFWATQLDLVAGWADLRGERCGEILSQLTPPVVFWSSIVDLDPQRHKWTLELLWTGLRLANHVEMRFKHALACRRPVKLSAQLQPMILTPGTAVAQRPCDRGHGGGPSALVADAGGRFQPEHDLFEQLMRQAARGHQPHDRRGSLPRGQRRGSAAGPDAG